MTKGQPYLPDLINAISLRYSFRKFPVTFEEIGGGTSVFSLGKWEDTQIDELTIYTDGLVARSRANSTVTEALVDDLYEFALNSFGIEKVAAPKEKRLYESAVVVQMESKVSDRLQRLCKGLKNDLDAFLGGYGAGDYDFQPGGLQFDVDATRHPESRPIPFALMRRVKTPYTENYWFSSGPLKTDDLVAVLGNLETALS